MTNLNYAPNENFTDALRASQILCQPQSWYRAGSIKKTQQKLAQLFSTNSKTIFLTLSARGALRAVFQTLDLPKDSQVIVQAFTCAAVILPIIESQLRPRYVDIETDSYSFDITSLRRAISAKSKVIILQHSFGIVPKNRSQVLKIAKKNNILVIEDLAHGFKPEIFQTDQAWPTIKLLSFGRSKVISCVHGGAIIIPQKEIAQKFGTIFDCFSPPDSIFIIKSLLYKIFSPLIVATYGYGFGKAVHLIFTKLHFFTKELSATEKMGKYDDWLDKKLPAALADCLIRQLDQYPQIVNKRQDIAKLYLSNLNLQSGSAKNSEYQLPIVRFPLLVDRRDEVMHMMQTSGFILGGWYTQPIAPRSINLLSLGYKKGSCPVAERVCTKIINLPLVINSYQARSLVEILKSL